MRSILKNEGDYGNMRPDLDTFRQVAKTVPSKFFTMEIAQRENGEWIIMELGDGQVSGLAGDADKKAFYRFLKQV